MSKRTMHMRKIIEYLNDSAVGDAIGLLAIVFLIACLLGLGLSEV